jgi:beta-galactosidase
MPEGSKGSRPPRSRRPLSSAPKGTEARAMRLRLTPEGLDLKDGREVLPLYAGAMHYWRHAPEEWGAGLDAMKSIGFRLVDTYVPWGVHETAPGEFDFGQKDPRNDVALFLRMCHERGLKVILRPGPHINAELTYFGLPERIVWDRECQARTPRGNPVMLPMVPIGFPVPSYASDAFHAETATWFAAVSAETAKLRHPEGPIVLVQIDNEGALYFRDGAYDQDYHPDSLRLFRAFLRVKYKSAKELRAAWREPQATFHAVEPPHRFDAKDADDLVRHLAWSAWRGPSSARGSTASPRRTTSPSARRPRL